MILFKVADKRLAEIGFIKDEENETMTMFRRVNKKLGYTQHLALIRGEDGRHIARCSDGVTIIGNVSCPRVLVKWGSGHSAYADI